MATYFERFAKICWLPTFSIPKICYLVLTSTSIPKWAKSILFLKVSKMSNWLFLCNHYSYTVLVKNVSQLMANFQSCSSIDNCIKVTHTVAIKAQGQMEFRLNFIKKIWSSISEILFDSFRKSFETGHLSPSQKRRKYFNPPKR